MLIALLVLLAVIALFGGPHYIRRGNYVDYSPLLVVILIAVLLYFLGAFK